MIEGCQAVPMNGRGLGPGLLGLVRLGLGEHDPDVSAGMERIVSECPTMLSCRNTTGEADFLLRVAGKDLDGYSRFVETIPRNLPDVVSVTTDRSLQELKLTGRLPVSAAPTA